MSGVLGDWVRSLVSGAFLSAVVLALTPEGKSRGAVKFVLGVLMTLLLLRPLVTWKPEDAALRFSELRRSAAGFSESSENLGAELTEAFIRKETEEYIWSAAERLGITELGVRLTLRQTEDGTIPWEAALRGSWTEAQRAELSFLLEGELGIPQARQFWSGCDAAEREEAAEGQ